MLQSCFGRAWQLAGPASATTKLVCIPTVSQKITCQTLTENVVREKKTFKGIPPSTLGGIRGQRVVLGPVTVTNSLTGPMQVRYAHTAVPQPVDPQKSQPDAQKQGQSVEEVEQQPPSNHFDLPPVNWDGIRKSKTMMPLGSTRTHTRSKRLPVYASNMFLGATAAGVGAIVARSALDVFLITPHQKALGVAEFELKEIPEGKALAVQWRGKPTYIRHRTQEEIAAAENVDLTTLRDPQSDDARTIRKEWLVVVGICTHLGCIPLSHQGVFGGFFCPCHGSHYDTSGRIRKGPAPLNLEIPPTRFVGDELLVIGES